MDNIYTRQSKACPRENIASDDILIVGCGAIGRNVAKQVALMGPNSITIVDDDIIEEHNCVPQMWPLDSIGQPKVIHMAEELARYCPNTKITPVQRKWYPIVGDKFHVVFACVDNITTRKNLFDFYQEKCQAFFDVRIGGGDMAMIISAIGNVEEKQFYKETLFNENEADGHGCAQPMTNFIASIASGLIVNNFARWRSGRGASVPKIKEFSSLTDDYLNLALESFK